MCFIKQCNEGTKPSIAEKNIKVYKVLERGNFPYFQNTVGGRKREPYVRGTHYTQTTPFRSKYWESGWFFDRPYLLISGDAFHSYLSKDVAKSNQDDGTIAVFMIPKGAKYYENGTEYVSSEIIFPHSKPKK